MRIMYEDKMNDARSVTITNLSAHFIGRRCDGKCHHEISDYIRLTSGHRTPLVIRLRL